MSLLAVPHSTAVRQLKHNAQMQLVLCEPGAVDTPIKERTVTVTGFFLLP